MTKENDDMDEQVGEEWAGGVVSCSCGNAATHQMARRTTGDGVDVVLWSDGSVTGRLGYALPGVPLRRGDVSAGWMLLSEACLYDADELGSLYDACFWAARRGLSVGAARGRLRRRRLYPTWQVLRADRDGRPRERVWRLPRLRWPGLVVWDYCSGRSRYELCSIDRGGVCRTTGLRFANLDELARHLDNVSAPAWQQSGRVAS